MTGAEATGMPVGDIITQFGFAGLIFIAFMFLLKWVLKTQEKILTDAKEERASWQTVMNNFQKNIETTSVQASEFHKQVTEAHSYQREEHNKILEGLNNVCNGIKGHTDCLDKMKENLEEQGKTLARINGYKE